MYSFRPPSIQIDFTHHPLFKSVQQRMSEINSMRIEQLIELKTDVQQMHSDKLREYRQYNDGAQLDLGIYGPQFNPYKNLFNAVESQIQKQQPIWFQPPTHLVRGYVLHGYTLRCTISNNSLSYTDYIKLRTIWNCGNDGMDTFDKFYEQFDIEACTEWSKMDRNGESFGGFWTADEGTYEREHAYELSRRDNARALWDLPYPKRIILHSVNVGCSNRIESVPFSASFCEYIKCLVDAETAALAIQNNIRDELAATIS